MPRNDTVIITFVNEAYIPVGLNWLSFVLALETDAAVKVVALDTATRDAFPSDVALYHPMDSTHLSDVWLFRMRLLRDILEAGVTVIHSDADAVWYRNPIPFLMSCGTDMIFSQGTVMPTASHARNGFVLCCGLFQMSPSPDVMEFMDALEIRVIVDRDDQVGINRLCDKWDYAWKIVDPYRIAFGDRAFTASRHPILSENARGPSISIIPHHRVPRLVNTLTPDLLVAHPLSPKSCAGKMKTLSALGLWS
ncbi:MAG: putative nucleotide-diphospho-sugar transferase [Pseudomonadota bacterium]